MGFLVLGFRAKASHTTVIKIAGKGHHNVEQLAGKVLTRS